MNLGCRNIIMLVSDPSMINLFVGIVFLLFWNFITYEIQIINSDATRDSYPRTSEIKVRVGFNRINIQIILLNELNLVIDICLYKKITDNENKKDCSIDNNTNAILIPKIDKNKITSGYPAGQ